MAIEEEITEVDAQMPMRDVSDRVQVGLLGNLNVGLWILMLIVHEKIVSAGAGVGPLTLSPRLMR